MFEFLSNTDTNDALAGVHFAMRRISHRQLLEAQEGSLREMLSAASVDARIGLMIIEEIERIERQPLKDLSASRAQHYTQKLANMAQERAKQTFGYNREAGQRMLKEWRKEPLRGISTISLPSPVSLTWAIGIYYFLLFVVFTYFVFVLWPGMTWDSELNLFGGLVRGKIMPETRMLLLVMAIGALGGCIHAAREFSWYVGNRQFRVSWVPWYLLLPLNSMAMALVLYFVIRSGIMSASASLQHINVFGIAALSALMGLFSTHGAKKVEEIFRSLLKQQKEQ